MILALRAGLTATDHDQKSRPGGGAGGWLRLSADCLVFVGWGSALTGREAPCGAGARLGACLRPLRGAHLRVAGFAWLPARPSGDGPQLRIRFAPLPPISGDPQPQKLEPLRLEPRNAVIEVEDMARRKRGAPVTEFEYSCIEHRIKAGERCYRCHDQLALFQAEECFSPEIKRWRRSRRRAEVNDGTVRVEISYRDGRRVVHESMPEEEAREIERKAFEDEEITVVTVTPHGVAKR